MSEGEKEVQDRVTAAAPDLLAACQYFMSACFEEEANEAVAMIRSAIEKATGETYESF